MTTTVIGRARDFPPDSCRIVDVDGLSVGVFNVSGRFYALLNRCPHQGAPLCKGIVSRSLASAQPGTYEYGRAPAVVRCPWHGWEFDLSTGASVWNPERFRARVYSLATRQSAAQVDRGAGAGLAATAFPVAVNDDSLLVLDTTPARRPPAPPVGCS